MQEIHLILTGKAAQPVSNTTLPHFLLMGFLFQSIARSMLSMLTYFPCFASAPNVVIWPKAQLT